MSVLIPSCNANIRAITLWKIYILVDKNLNEVFYELEPQYLDKIIAVVPSDNMPISSPPSRGNMVSLDVCFVCI